MLNDPRPSLCEIAFLFLFWFLDVLITRNWNSLKIIEGADAALFSYAALYKSGLLDAHSADAIGLIPHNLLIGMGLSIVKTTGTQDHQLPPMCSRERSQKQHSLGKHIRQRRMALCPQKNSSEGSSALMKLTIHN